MRCAANGAQQEAAAPRRQAGSSLASPLDENDDVFDIVAAARSKTASAASPPDAPPQQGPVKDFLSKCAAAYRIFFPPQQRNLSPKDLGRNRLRMILVADRCAMNPASLSDMKCVPFAFYFCLEGVSACSAARLCCDSPLAEWHNRYCRGA